MLEPEKDGSCEITLTLGLLIRPSAEKRQPWVEYHTLPWKCRAERGVGKGSGRSPMRHKSVLNQAQEEARTGKASHYLKIPLRACRGGGLANFRK